MSPAFKDVVVLRNGDAEGNHMVVKLTTDKGLDLYAIAVPQDRPVRTGPTWTYLFENEGLNLVDAGSAGSFKALAEGIEQVGVRIKDIDRVIITHGHADHDGAAKQLVEEADAELWAHDVYAHLLPFNPWEIQHGSGSPFRDEIRRITQANSPRNHSDTSRFTDSSYVNGRKNLEVNYKIRNNDQFGDMKFMHTPGHSPDELCLTLDGLVFTGDHVLPEITPHPTTKVSYTEEVKQNLPEEYHDADGLYGLGTYLKSLKLIVDLGPDILVLPAHRLFNKNKFNFKGVRRAKDVIQHHNRRLKRILSKIDDEPASLEDVTRGLFPRRKLSSGVLYMALTEAVAHVELLEDTGDLEVTEDRRLRRTGSDNYRQFIHELSN